MLADIDIRAPAQLLRVASFKLQKSVESLISSGDEVSALRDRFQGLSWKTFFLSIKHFIANSSLQHWLLYLDLILNVIVIKEIDDSQI